MKIRSRLALFTAAAILSTNVFAELSFAKKAPLNKPLQASRHEHDSALMKGRLERPERLERLRSESKGPAAASGAPSTSGSVASGTSSGTGSSTTGSVTGNVGSSTITPGTSGNVSTGAVTPGTTDTLTPGTSGNVNTGAFTPGTTDTFTPGISGSSLNPDAFVSTPSSPSGSFAGTGLTAGVTAGSSNTGSLTVNPITGG